MGSIPPSCTAAVGGSPSSALWTTFRPAAGSGKSGPPALSTGKEELLSQTAVQDGGVGIPDPDGGAERYPGPPQ